MDRSKKPVALLFGLGLSIWAADPPKLLRSLSGPSGKTVGPEFVLDEVRNRFVFPNDKSLIVYFQWEAPPGDHLLTGIWKEPDGTIATISPDVKVETSNSALNCYWIFSLVPGLPNGVWTLEVRVDGQPAGSHAFEIAGMETRANQPTVDQIFRTVSRSLVRIRKVNDAGRKSDPATGFVIQPNAIATAFQSIDSARQLEIEFGDGRKATTDEVLAVSRTADWAILKVPTGSLPTVPLGNVKDIVVGGRLLAFNVESNVRVVGGVDIGGHSVVSGFGARIQLAPALDPEAVGGPLLDGSGRIVGILGGSLTPGARMDQRLIKSTGALQTPASPVNAATAISELPRDFGPSGRPLEELARAGVLTPPLQPMAEFLYGGTLATLPKRADDPLPTEATEFSPRDPEVYVYSYWKRQGKVSKGEISAAIYDTANHLRINVPPKQFSLRYDSSRLSFAFSPSTLQPGIHRIDLLWNGAPAWRTFIRITE